MRRPHDATGGGMPWRGLAVLRELRRRTAFAQLPRAEWATFVAIASFWDSNAAAWPPPATIARLAGYRSRSVRSSIASLERRGIVRRLGERSDGDEGQAGFGPGPLTLREVRALALVELVTPAAAIRAWEETEAPVSALATIAAGAAMVAADPPKKNTKTNTKISKGALPLASSMEPPADEPEDLPLSKDRDDERAIIRAALADWFHRRRPRSAVPARFPPPDEAQVSRCVAAVDGDLDTKLQALRDSIVGAFYLSDRPPTVRYIWGKREHFLAHVERGRAIRLACD